MSSEHQHFDGGYGEDAELSDGTRVRLRVVRPDDRERLRRGFGELSPQSRYLRFMAAKAELTERELDRLSELDGEDRFAIGALRLDASGVEGDGLGVARFARLPDEPAVAEAAVTVVDEVQGRGLGSLLLRRLSAAARERGVERFRGEILLRNRAMRRLLEEHGDVSVVDTGHETVRVLVELPSFESGLASSSERSNLLGRLLAQAAGGGLTVRLGDVLLKRK